MGIEHRIITFGLSEEQNDLVKSNLPAKDYEVFDTNAPTDMIAIGCVSLIVHAAALDEDAMGMLIDFYEQVDGCTDETVIWLGEPLPPKRLQKSFKCYPSFEEIEGKLKYLLLNAHRQSKNADDYSEKFVNGIQIISYIRRKPGIKTKELAELLEISPRSVQRYITALQVAGENIEYDPSRKGWSLLDGKSVFFGDFWGGAE